MRRRSLYAVVLAAADLRGSVQALADEMDMSLSALLRGAKALKLSTDTLLRLAEVTGEPPSTILRLAGRDDTAGRIERLYGEPRAALSPDDRALLALTPEQKKLLRQVAEQF